MYLHYHLLIVGSYVQAAKSKKKPEYVQNNHHDCSIILFRIKSFLSALKVLHKKINLIEFNEF